MAREYRDIHSVAYDFYIGETSYKEWQPPKLVDLDGASAIKIVDVPYSSYVMIQNLGTTPVFIAINYGETTGLIPPVYNLILAGGNTALDGRGALLILKSFRGFIYAWTSGATGKVSVTIGKCE